MSDRELDVIRAALTVDRATVHKLGGVLDAQTRRVVPAALAAALRKLREAAEKLRGE